MTELPTTQDVRHAREQVDSAISTTFGAVKSPLLAALGAVDAATQAVIDAFHKARHGATGRAEEAQSRLQKALNELQSRVSELPNEVAELRHRLEPAELRKTAEEYREAAQRAYTSLIERGEEVYGEFRSRPGVKHALESVESSVDTAQERLEIAVRDLNAAIDELRGRFARTSRVIGEQAAQRTEEIASSTSRQVQETAEEVSETVRQTGREAAATTRSASRKVADRAAPARKPANRRPGENSTRKS